LSNLQDKKVAVVHGSKNVWSKRADSTFHLTVVVRIETIGFAVPLFIVLHAHCIPGGSVTVAPKGLMNAHLFKKWLSHFHSAIPKATKRPLILVYDGYSSGFNEGIVTKAISLNFILVILPTNLPSLCNCWILLCFSHKTIMKRILDQKMIENSIVSISKKMQ
jgi:DDE superfamily endonuclease